MESYNFVTKCTVCKRKMLVTQTLIGVNHTASTSVTCPDCTAKIDWDNNVWAKHNPEEAKELREELENDYAICKNCGHEVAEYNKVLYHATNYSDSHYFRLRCDYHGCDCKNPEVEDD